MEGALAPVVQQHKFEDEKRLLFLTYGRSRFSQLTAQASGLFCWPAMSASACTSSPSRSSSVTSSQASAGPGASHSLLCDYDPPVGGVLSFLAQQLGNVVVGPDPSLLECRAEIFDVALCLCRVAAESTGS